MTEEKIYTPLLYLNTPTSSSNLLSPLEAKRCIPLSST